MPEPATEMLTLDREECLALLAANNFGRIAVRTGDGTPAVRPVNYSFDEPSQSVVFHTGRGSKFQALVHEAHAAFEIDSIDPDGDTGWSVIVSGVVEEVTNRAEVQRLSERVVRSWAPANKPFWMRLRAFTVSGRRIARVSR